VVGTDMARLPAFRPGDRGRVPRAEVQVAC